LGPPNQTGLPIAPRSRRRRTKTGLGWSTNGARRLQKSCLLQRPILARSLGSALNSRAVIFLTCPSKKNGLNGRSPMTSRSLRHIRREPKGAHHEAPAPIGQKAQPATDRRAFETARRCNPRLTFTAHRHHDLRVVMSVEQEPSLFAPAAAFSRAQVRAPHGKHRARKKRPPTEAALAVLYDAINLGFSLFYCHRSANRCHAGFVFAFA
jgi:hypothetical protein